MVTEMPIELICGPMFSGKTDELIRRLREAEQAGQRVLTVKPALDDRYSRSAIVSHNGARRAAAAVDEPGEIAPLAAGFDAVGIDEAHFLGAELGDVVRELGASGTRVVVSGLDLDFRRRPFAAVGAVAEAADAVTRLEAVCARCGAPAGFTQRLVDGRPAASDAPPILVGGPESYEPRCGRCHELG
jgi:thymidine kinase